VLGWLAEGQGVSWAKALVKAYEDGYRRGYWRGYRRGYQQGRVRTQREDLRIVLEERFGPLPVALVQQIEASDDCQRLEAVLRQVVHLQRLDDLQL
jgi:hypothetical protein